MTQAFETLRVGQLIRQVARPELKESGYPVAVDCVFAVWTGDDAAPLYPVKITVETAVAERSGGPVLVEMEEVARQMLRSALNSIMTDDL